jgi:hypothetical protein
VGTRRESWLQIDKTEGMKFAFSQHYNLRPLTIQLLFRQNSVFISITISHIEDTEVYRFYLLGRVVLYF